MWGWAVTVHEPEGSYLGGKHVLKLIHGDGISTKLKIIELYTHMGQF